MPATEAESVLFDSSLDDQATAIVSRGTCIAKYKRMGMTR